MGKEGADSEGGGGGADSDGGGGADSDGGGGGADSRWRKVIGYDEALFFQDSISI